MRRTRVYKSQARRRIMIALDIFGVAFGIILSYNRLDGNDVLGDVVLGVIFFLVAALFAAELNDDRRSVVRSR